MMTAFKCNNLTQSSIYSFHDNDVTVGLSKQVHPSLNCVVIHLLVQICTRQFLNFIQEIQLAQQTGKTMTGSVGVGSNENSLLKTIGINLVEPPIGDVFFFDCILHKDLLCFDSESIVQFVEYFKRNRHALYEGIRDGKRIADKPSLLLLLDLPKFSERRVVAVRQRGVRVLQAAFWNVTGLDFFSAASHSLL